MLLKKYKTRYEDSDFAIQNTSKWRYYRRDKKSSDYPEVAHQGYYSWREDKPPPKLHLRNEMS